MLKIYKDKMTKAVEDLRQEASRRAASTPSDVSIEAFKFAANRVEAAIAEAERETQRLTPAQYAEVHNVTPQTVTRWIRLGELEAEETASGYLIARDAVRVARIRNDLEQTG